MSKRVKSINKYCQRSVIVIFFIRDFGAMASVDENADVPRVSVFDKPIEIIHYVFTRGVRAVRLEDRLAVRINVK